jgi:hypothetical protein
MSIRSDVRGEVRAITEKATQESNSVSEGRKYLPTGIPAKYRPARTVIE